MLQFNVELCALEVTTKTDVASEFACPVEFYFTGVSDVGRSLLAPWNSISLGSPTLRGLFLRELM